MATITANTFLDGGTTRTAGESWTMNGGILTIRTDTRWHANAPASMTGSIGSTTISSTLGGGILIDGRDVRWMPFNSGTGSVPAIGTTVIQGGVSGYLLGVWSALDVAPSAVSSAMPTTGWLKFREVSGGNFSVGALSGIGASAAGPDVLGWIEVVQDQAAANTVPRLGFFRVRGGWFELGETDGNASQIVQIPTNGGGVNTRVPAVWIETSPGSGVYESYPSLSITYFLSANLSTDERSKFVFTDSNGRIRIGGDGTNSIGYLPPAGCKIRIPNVLGRQCTTAARSTNAAPNATLATRPDFTTTSAGEIDFEYFANDWYHAFTSAYKVRIVNCATLDAHTSVNDASPTDIQNYAIGAYQAVGLVTLTNNSLGGTIDSLSIFRGDAASNGHCVSITGCSGYTINNLKTGIVTYARSSGAVTLSQCRNIVINNSSIYAATLSFATCQNIVVSNLTYIDRLVGTSNSTTGKYAVSATVSSDNIKVDGVSFGGFANVHPYSGLFNASNSSNLTFRNAGTYASPIGGATLAPAYIFLDSGNNDTIRVQRCYLTATRTGIYSLINTSKNITVQNCNGTVGAVATASNNSSVFGVRAASYSTTGQASVYGTHWFDMFTGDTTGRLWLAFNEPTSFSSSQYEAISLGVGAGFTSGGQISMPNVGDQIIFTMPYYAIGHTGFENTAPIITGSNTGNFNIEYQLDTGSGFSGSWSTLNATNLAAESFLPATGFRMKIRCTVTTANASNALTYIGISTSSTSADQSSNLYPLDYSSINLTGLISGSRVQIYDVTNNQELYNEIISSSSLSYSAPYSSDFSCRIRIMYQSGTSAKKFVEFTETVGINGLSRSVSQEDDSIYIVNAIDGSTVSGISIADGPMLVNATAGSLTWPQIYAYETYWLMTEEGIRDEGRFIEAVDPANYRLSEFKIKNVGAGSLVISGGYGVDSTTGNAIDIIDTTGGTIVVSPDHVVAYATSGESSTAAIATAVRTAIRPDLDVINDGVQKSSLLIPHATDL